jgi:hypothetical protein
MSKKRSEFIDYDGEPVFINTQLQVNDGQDHPIGFLYDQFPRPKPKAKRRRVTQRPRKKVRKRKG